MAECICYCGARFTSEYSKITTGHKLSCGCRTKVRVPGAIRTTLKKKVISREYSAWQAMKRRCYNEKSHNYSSYGGRGIQVSEDWNNSFALFLENMGVCPPGFTLDRINSNENYSAANCRWASVTDQNRNKRASVHVLFNGNEMPLAALAEVTKLSYGPLHYLIVRRKISADDAVSRLTAEP